MKNIIVGAYGFLGSYLQNELEKHNSEYLALNHGEKAFKNECENISFDVNNQNDIFDLKEKLKEEKDINIIYLASIHSPDFIKTNRQLAYETNVLALKNFISLIPFDKFIYASSDVVYGESKTSQKFTERSELSPINEYGKQKAQAEKIVLECGGTVLRFSSLMGKSLICERKTFYDEVYENLSKNKELILFKDFSRNIISYKLASEIIYKLLCTNKLPSVINVGSSELISKYEMGIRIARKYGFAKENIIAKEMDNSNLFYEKRAKEINVDNTLLRSILSLGEIKYNGE